MIRVWQETGSVWVNVSTTYFAKHVVSYFLFSGNQKQYYYLFKDE